MTRKDLVKAPPTKADLVIVASGNVIKLEHNEGGVMGSFLGRAIPLYYYYFMDKKSPITEAVTV
jgi:hypothetical protein